MLRILDQTSDPWSPALPWRLLPLRAAVWLMLLCAIGLLAASLLECCAAALAMQMTDIITDAWFHSLFEFAIAFYDVCLMVTVFVN